MAGSHRYQRSSELVAATQEGEGSDLLRVAHARFFGVTSAESPPV